MPVSPICQVKDGNGVFQSTTDGVDVTPGNTVTIRLASPADVWSIACISVDNTSNAAAVNASLVVDSLQKTATFTAPVAGKAYRFQSTVQQGIGPDGVARPDYKTTFGVYTRVLGRRVHALDETFESNALQGWGADINDVIRNPTGPTINGTSGQILTSNGAGAFGTPITPPSGLNGRILTANGSGGFGASLAPPGGAFGGLVTSDGAGGFGITIIPPAGSLVGTSATQALTSKTIDASSNTLSNITNTSISPTAAIDGSKIYPSFGSQTVFTTGQVVGGSSVQAGGGSNYLCQIRPHVTVPTSFGGLYLLPSATAPASGNYAVLGDITNAWLNAPSGAGFVGLSQGGAVETFRVYRDRVETTIPITGGATPYSVHGFATIAFPSDANYTVTAAQYSNRHLYFTNGAWTAGRQVVLPSPSTQALGYYIHITNATNYTITISTGVGANKTIATNTSQMFWIDSTGPWFASGTWTR